MFNIKKSACVLAAAFFVSLTTWGNAFAEGEGCTPGFWKQEHHFYDWQYTNYSPTDSFHEVFGANGVGINGILTLHMALKARGGGIHAVYRHGVAALLNAAHPYVGYPFWYSGDALQVNNTNGSLITPDVVILAVRAAYNCHVIGDKYCVEQIKDELEYVNEIGSCPLPMEMHAPW